jgi:hypothetical protein
MRPVRQLEVSLALPGADIKTLQTGHVHERATSGADDRCNRTLFHTPFCWVRSVSHARCGSSFDDAGRRGPYSGTAGSRRYFRTVVRDSPSR